MLILCEFFDYSIFLCIFAAEGCENGLRLGNSSVLDCSRLAPSLSPRTKKITIMTSLAQRIKETPMAPYMALLQGMTREQKQIVVTFITESMEEPVGKRQVPEEFKRLRGMVNITDEEIAEDEHLAHIMER